MNKINSHVYSVFITLFVIVVFIFISYVYVESQAIPEHITNIQSIFIVSVFFAIIIFMLALLFVMMIRKQIISFSTRLMTLLDQVLTTSTVIKFNNNEETLLSKVENQLQHMSEVMVEREKKNKDEKNHIKTLISDISHQVKTPLANIIMYNDTLRQRDLNEEHRKQFLNNMKLQLQKLDWLIQSLIKMSRLESSMIQYKKNNIALSETIAVALSGIYTKAEQKAITFEVTCDQQITLHHDPKWTSEAIFNVLDNAVKYTNNGGKISILVEKWELFTVISISDTGIGIAANEITEIFKRFYRSHSVSAIEGVGIGLFLTREIISGQGGYMKVKSQQGVGSTFSIFLPNDYSWSKQKFTGDSF